MNIKNKSFKKKVQSWSFFLNSRYNPISKEINIFLIDDNMFDLVTINVAIHELCHYFLDKSKAGNEKNSILLKTLNIVTKLISMPSVIILLLTTIFRFFQLHN